MIQEKIYAVFEGNRIVRMSRNKDELVKYLKSFPPEERKKMFLAEKIIAGPKEYQQSHWMFKK